MAVNSTDTVAGPFIGNGVTTVFPFTFSAASENEVGVLLRSAVGDAMLTGGYSATLSANGGSVSIIPAPAVGTLVYLLSDPDFTQEIEFYDGARYLADSVNEANDRAAMRDLVLRAQVSRTFQVPIGEAGSTIESAAVRSGKVAWWDLAGRMRSISYSSLATTLAPLIASVLGPFAKGDPGGNVMSIGLFLAIATVNPITGVAQPGISIPLGTDRVDVSGYAAKGFPYRLINDDATVTPAYVAANPRTSVISANGRGFRLDLSQPLFVEMAGGIADRTITDFDYKGGGYISSWAVPAGVTDNLPALKALFAVVAQTRALNTGGALQEGGVRTPIGFGNTNGAMCYHMGDTVIPPVTVALIGRGGGGDSYDGVGTMLAFPPNVNGITFNSYATQPAGYAKIGTGGSQLKGLRFAGGGGTDRTAHGLWQRVPIEVDDCVFEKFAGNNTHNVASVGYPVSDARFGLTSGTIYRRVTRIHAGNWNGYLAGSDCSASTFIDVHDKGSRLGGQYDAGYFENTYIGYQCNEHANGRVGACYNNGRIYQLDSPAPGIGATTQPGTADTIWEDIGAASGPSSYFPQWSPSVNYELSVPTFAASPSVTFFGYTEVYYLRSVGGTLRGTMAVGRYCSGMAADPADGNVDLYNHHFLFRGDILPTDPLYATMGSEVDVWTGGNPTARHLLRGYRTGKDQAGYAEAYAGPNVRRGVGVPGTGSPASSYFLPYYTTATLGNPTVQRGYEVFVRFAMGGPGESMDDARQHETVPAGSGVPAGTYNDDAGTKQNWVRGRWWWNNNVTPGGIARWAAMGDGTVQPEGIVGAVQIQGLSSSSTAAAIVAALKASGLAA